MDAPARRPEPTHAADVVREDETPPEPSGSTPADPLDALRAAVPELDELRGGRVLDVRAGGADVVRADALRELLPDASLEPVELSGGALERTPRLPVEDGAADGVIALSLFTRADRTWAGWLVECQRVLRPGGLLVAGVLGRDHSELVAGRRWSPDDVGLGLLAPAGDEDGPVVVVSPWWLRAHWGRAFDVVRHEPLAPAALEGLGLGGRELVVARPRPERAAAADLERDEPDEPREERARAHAAQATREELRATAARLADLAARHERLVGMWEDASAQVEGLLAQGVERDERIAHLEARVVELGRRGSHDASADASLRAERQAARRQSAELGEKLREHQQELARVRTALEVVYASKSWRITAPLRARAASIRRAG